MQGEWPCPNTLVRILENASLFIEYMNTDLTISASLQILSVVLGLNFCLCLQGITLGLGGDNSC